MALTIAAFIGLAASVHAEQFPWEPAKPVPPPPLNSTQSKAPQFETPEVRPPARIVPGHKSRYGYVPTYRSEAPVHAPAEPGEKAGGWVPGHHDNNGAWVPGHPE